MIHTITLNPSIDQHITVKKLIPKDKITPENIRLEPGGKGFNVARVIRELGGKTKAFGFSGGQTGAALKALLENEKIVQHLCPIGAEIRTNLVINDRSNATQFRINPLGPRLDQNDVKRLLDMLERALPRPDFWVLCGSIPPGVGDDIYKRLIKLLQARGELCALDTDGSSLKRGLQAQPFMIKPNAFELERLIGRPCRNKTDILAVGCRLTQSAQVVAITLGKKGAYVFTPKDAWYCSAPAVPVKSDVGAGDAFLGGFLTALDRGEGFVEASRWAVAAATSSVTNDGTARCELRDVNKLLAKITIKKVSYG